MPSDVFFNFRSISFNPTLSPLVLAPKNPYTWIKNMDDFKPPKPRTNKYPPQGITLEMMVVALVECYGWERLGEKINIRCFNYDPSVKSSLTFLRKTPWAREQVEKLFTWRNNTGWDPRDDHK